tara:strand:- start:3498 stop:4532 length:1035 start_codon:yes stop_codon:yes gene_type:complete
MGIQSHFDDFHRRIKLTRQDERYKKARQRDDSITAAIKTAFKEAGYEVIEDFLVGSHAYGTAIVPLDGDYDIDRALVIAADDAPDDPVKPKVTILGVLENRGFKNAKIKMPCVTADYASESVHIDYPLYKVSLTQYHLAVGKKNSGATSRIWSGADPHGLIEWIRRRDHYGASADKKQEQFRRLQRYLKRWRDHQFSESVAAKIYSIGLAVMVKERFSPSFNAEGFRQDLTALRHTVGTMLDAGYFAYQSPGRYTVSVSLPVEPWRDIFDGASVETGSQLRNKLQTLKNKLDEVADMDDEHKQCKILNKLFGDDFIVPDQPSKSESTSKAVYPSAGAVGTSQGA